MIELYLIFLGRKVYLQKILKYELTYFLLSLQNFPNQMDLWSALFFFFFFNSTNLNVWSSGASPEIEKLVLPYSEAGCAEQFLDKIISYRK